MVRLKTTELVPATVKQVKSGFEYYPDDMDKDMIPICNALNSLDGVRTFFCCSGHGRSKEGAFYISLGCSNIRLFKLITKCFDICRRGITPEVRKPYRLEPEHDFWPLRKNEMGIRISNKCVDHLNYWRRKREFGRIVKELTESERND